MTAAKMIANRANAQHSTGPQDTSATRFNGVQHGLTSKQTVLPGESQEEYDEFREEFLNDLSPVSALERTLADRIIAAAWRMKRFERVETSFYNNRIDAYCKENPHADPSEAMANLFIDPAESTRMRLFLRYQTGVQKEFDKALNEFRKAQAEAARNAFQSAVGFASQSDPEPISDPCSSTFIGGQNRQEEIPNHHHAELVMKLQSDRATLGSVG